MKIFLNASIDNDNYQNIILELSNSIKVDKPGTNGLVYIYTFKKVK